MKDKLKFLKTVPGILLLTAVVLLITAGSLWYLNQKSKADQEKKIIAGLEHKDVKQITPQDFRVLFKRAERIDSGDQMDGYVTKGQVAWIVTQADPKDSDTVNLVGRYSFDIAGKAQFFKTSPRKVAVGRLESWASANGVKTNNVQGIPDPSQPKILSFIKSGPGILGILMVLVIASLFIWMFWRGPMSGSKKFLRTRKERAIKNKTLFADAGGVREAKEELEITIRLLRRAKRFVRLGAIGKRLSPRIRKGILLVGPPGTGKTLLARAMANEAGVPFLEASGTEFVEMFVGVGAARVRDLFNKAKKLAPCIVFIDEIEAVGRKRTGGLGTSGDREGETTLGELLNQMDGFDKETGVLVIGATNMPELLDKALKRPGRFDLEVLVDLPDFNDRVAILNVHTKSRSLSSDANLEIIAKQTPGFSGADLENLVNEAHIIADLRLGEEEEKSAEITMKDLENSIDKVTFGGQKKTPMSKKDKRRFAVHEAGHALVAYVQENKGGEPVHKISVVQRSHTGGHVKTLHDESLAKPKSYYNARLALFAGGYVAEEIYFEGDVSAGASGDLEYMTNLAQLMIAKWGMGDHEALGFRTFGKGPHLRFLEGSNMGEADFSPATAVLVDEAVKKLTNGAKELAKQILIKEGGRFEYMVERLIDAETIQGDDLRKLLEEPIPASK